MWINPSVFGRFRAIKLGLNVIPTCGFCGSLMCREKARVSNPLTDKQEEEGWRCEIEMRGALGKWRFFIGSAD